MTRGECCHCSMARGKDGDSGHAVWCGAARGGMLCLALRVRSEQARNEKTIVWLSSLSLYVDASNIEWQTLAIRRSAAPVPSGSN